MRLTGGITRRACTGLPPGCRLQCTISHTKNNPLVKVLDQVRRACRTKHLSLRTEQAYIRWTRRYVRYHGLRHPRQLGDKV